MIHTITVAELRRLLADEEDDDARVVCSCDYGDISHTEQAIELDGKLKEVRLERSAYSRSGWAVAAEREPQDEPEEEVEGPWVLLLG